MGLSGDITASSFCKAASSRDKTIDDFSNEDRAKSLLHMISNDIGQLAYLYGKIHNCKRVKSVLTCASAITTSFYRWFLVVFSYVAIRKRCTRSRLALITGRRAQWNRYSCATKVTWEQSAHLCNRRDLSIQIFGAKILPPVLVTARKFQMKAGFYDWRSRDYLITLWFD